jgi:hypothetical protein
MSPAPFLRWQTLPWLMTPPCRFLDCHGERGHAAEPITQLCGRGLVVRSATYLHLADQQEHR